MKYIYSLYLLILFYNQIQLLFSEMVNGKKWTDAEDIIERPFFLLPRGGGGGPLRPG